MSILVSENPNPHGERWKQVLHITQKLAVHEVLLVFLCHDRSNRENKKILPVGCECMATSTLINFSEYRTADPLH